MSYQGVNNPAGGAESFGSSPPAGDYQNSNGGNYTDSSTGNYNEPTTGSDSWDNPGTASDADGFEGENEGGENTDFDSPNNDSETDEFDENGNPIEREPGGGDGSDGGQDGAGAAGATPKQVPITRLNEVIGQRDSWREPARQWGISDPGQLNDLFSELSEWRRLAADSGGNFVSPHDIRAQMETQQVEQQFAGPIQEFVADGRMDQEVADHIIGFFRDNLAPVLKEAASAKPLVQRLQAQEQQSRFDNYIGGLKQRFPNMDETAVIHAARANADPEAEAERTHRLYANRSRANRQREAVDNARNGQRPAGVPRVETRQGGGSANPNAMPDPTDTKAWDAYNERYLATRGGNRR